MHFLDAETLTLSKTINMPSSTHELALSPEGHHLWLHLRRRKFHQKDQPDWRIVVIDLPSKSLHHVIDLGATYAPHGVMIDASGRALVVG